MDFGPARVVLAAIDAAEQADEALALEAIARLLDLSHEEASDLVESIDRCGLALTGQDGESPRLLSAGRQYLERGGNVDDAVLEFLPMVIDDLDAREALLNAGTIMVEEFREAISAGGAVEHAREVVPEAFAAAVTEPLALRLFAAAVALTVRLSNGRPAGCVAEEILAMTMLGDARVWLDMKVEEGALGASAARDAGAHLSGIFELFGDDDVARMFHMAEPADAALAGHSELNHQLGVVDQRLEAWFLPFGGTAPTGHLDEPGDRRD